MSNDVTPVPVVIDWTEIKNFAREWAKPRVVRKTTVRTYLLDITGANGPAMIQVCDYEPSRVRMTIQPIDADITVTGESPLKSPDVSSATVAPQGAHLAKGIQPYEFWGPDALWLNSLTGTTRVTVIKEYC